MMAAIVAIGLGVVVVLLVSLHALGAIRTMRRDAERLISSCFDLAEEVEKLKKNKAQVVPIGSRPRRPRHDR